MTNLESLEQEVSSWPGVSIHPHRFAGREFRFYSAEIGHVHYGGLLDIPFPRKICDVLLSENLAEEHRWVPNSRWISFRVRSQENVAHALWLLRLSYLRYALKSTPNPRGLLEKAAEELHLNAQFKSLLAPFNPKEASQAA